MVIMFELWANTPKCQNCPVINGVWVWNLTWRGGQNQWCCSNAGPRMAIWLPDGGKPVFEQVWMVEGQVFLMALMVNRAGEAITALYHAFKVLSWVSYNASHRTRVPWSRDSYKLHYLATLQQVWHALMASTTAQVGGRGCLYRW